MFENEIIELEKIIVSKDKNNIEINGDTFFREKLLSITKNCKTPESELYALLKATAQLISLNRSRAKYYYSVVIGNLIQYQPSKIITFFAEQIIEHMSEFFNAEVAITGLYFGETESPKLKKIVEDNYLLHSFIGALPLLKHYLINCQLNQAFMILKQYAYFANESWAKTYVQNQISEWLKQELSFTYLDKKKSLDWFRTFLNEGCGLLLIFFQELNETSLFNQLYNQCIEIIDELKFETLKENWALFKNKTYFSLNRKTVYDFSYLHQTRTSLTTLRMQLKNKNIIIDKYRIETLEVLKKITAKVIQQLPEKPCDFEIIYFGSASQGDFTVNSDLDIGFLLEDASYRQHPYFKILFECLRLTFEHIGFCFYDEQKSKTIFLGHGLDASDLNAIASADLSKMPLTNEPVAMAQWIGAQTEHHSAKYVCNLLFAKSLYATSAQSLYAKFQKALFDQTIKIDLTETLSKPHNDYIHLKNEFFRPLKIGFTQLMLPTKNFFVSWDALFRHLTQLSFVHPFWVKTLTADWQWLNELRTQTQLERPGPEDILFLPHDEEKSVETFLKMQQPILKEQKKIIGTPEQIKKLELIQSVFLKSFYDALPRWVNHFETQSHWDPLAEFLKQNNYIAFTEYLIQSSASPQDHLYYYQKIPEAKRFEYYQALHKAAQSHQNPKLAHDILTLVGQYPLKNGWRAAPLLKQQQWHQLMRTFLSNYQENECFIEMQNLNNKHEVTRYGLSSEFKQALFEPGKTYFRKSDETQLLNAQHKVLAIPNSKHPKFWCKFFPENPGGEAFDSIFSGLLTGEAGPNHLFAILHIPHGANKIKIPVLLSQHVPGSSLSEKEITEEPQKLNRINVISFFKAFLRVVFLNPEDDRGEDYKLTPMEHSDEFELMVIDRERTNYSSHEKKMISDKLLVKSMVYCLNQMETEIPEHDLLLYLRDVIEPELLLETFLQATEKLTQLYSKLISPADLESYFNSATETQLKILQHPEEKKFMTAGIYVFVIRPDSIKDLFNTFTLLKELLTTTTEHLRPKMLLNILQPKISSVYQPLFTLIPIDKKHPEQALTRFWSIKEVKQELTCVQGLTKSNSFNLAKTHAASTPEKQYQLELKDLKDIYERKPHPCSIETANLELKKLSNNKLLTAKDLCQARQGWPLTLLDWYRLLNTFQLLSSKQKVYLLNELEKEMTTLQAIINEPNNARWKEWLPFVKTDHAALIRTLMDIAFTLASKVNWVRLDLSFYETCFKNDSALENFLQQTGTQLMALTLSNIHKRWTMPGLLKALKHCPYLTSLTIQQSDLNFTQTSPPLKNLIYLKLKDCKVNDADLKKMMTHPLSLHTLIIEGDNQVLYADDYCEFPFLLSTPWEKIDVEIKESIIAKLKILHTYDITPVRAELLQALILLLKKEYPNPLEFQTCIEGFRLPVKAHPTLYQATSESLEKATLLNQLRLQYHENTTAFQYEKKAAYWFQKAAKLKLAEAQYHLAYYYDEGMGVPQNKIKAFEYYHLAALQEHARAQNNLGLCYLLGEGGEKNEALALHWFEAAAKKELAVAFYHLAVCYECGYGTQKNSAQALRYYQLAAKQNHVAQCALGFYLLEIEHHAELKALPYMQASAQQENLTAQRWLRFYYQTIQDKKLADDWNLKLQNYGDKQKRTIKTLNFKYGKNIEHDAKKAVQYYQKLAELGNAVAQYNLGVCYYNGQGVKQDFKQAVFWYQKAADVGHASAQFNLGVCYYNGQGVNQDFKQAVFWYQKAADLGDVSAQSNLGFCYYNGRGVNQDFKQAIFWYQKAADVGHASAQCNLGNIYYTGHGVKQDNQQAVFWYQKAADFGNASAQFNLGNIYYNLGNIYYTGHGVKQDDQQAVFWYQKAADLGNDSAQYNLGIRYEKGQGVSQDFKQAVFWYQKAAGQGDKDASKQIEEILKKQPELKNIMSNAHNFYSSSSENSPNPKEEKSFSFTK